MQGRVAAGIGAWVIGVVSATALSLVAVSVFGHDAANSHGPVLTQDDIAKALASATAAPPTSPDSPSAGTPGGASGTPSSATPPTPGPTSSSTVTPTNSVATTISRALSSPAGTVVVRCQGSLVYLMSWSPAQGFRVAGIQRGPGRVAAVDFLGPQGQVVMRYYCSGGTPASGGDDGPWDH